jgi:hypothetical protein
MNTSGTPLNVRKAPDGEIIGALSNGTLVTTGERREGWAWITPEGIGKSGWVRGKYLKCAQKDKKALVGDSVQVHPWTGDEYTKICMSKNEESIFACLMYTRGVTDGIVVRSYFSKDEDSICIPAKMETSQLV